MILATWRERLQTAKVCTCFVCDDQKSKSESDPRHIAQEVPCPCPHFLPAPRPEQLNEAKVRKESAFVFNCLRRCNSEHCDSDTPKPCKGCTNTSWEESLQGSAARAPPRNALFARACAVDGWPIKKRTVAQANKSLRTIALPYSYRKETSIRNMLCRKLKKNKKVHATLASPWLPPPVATPCPGLSRTTRRRKEGHFVVVQSFGWLILKGHPETENRPPEV